MIIEDVLFASLGVADSSEIDDVPTLDGYKCSMLDSYDDDDEDKDDDGDKDEDDDDPECDYDCEDEEDDDEDSY